jgi:hypothetical protein
MDPLLGIVGVLLLVVGILRAVDLFARGANL